MLTFLLCEEDMNNHICTEKKLYICMYLQKGLSGCTALRMRNTRNYVIEQSMASEE